MKCVCGKPAHGVRTIDGDPGYRFFIHKTAPSASHATRIVVGCEVTVTPKIVEWTHERVEQALAASGDTLSPAAAARQGWRSA